MQGYLVEGATPGLLCGGVVVMAPPVVLGGVVPGAVPDMEPVVLASPAGGVVAIGIVEESVAGGVAGIVALAEALAAGGVVASTVVVSFLLQPASAATPSVMTAATTKGLVNRMSGDLQFECPRPTTEHHR